ncbi:MAG: PKD domain-containing protein [Bacteroidota bacterium]|nr:PKD domain-containing protein [Bacteroidota bacterium]
MNTKTTTSLNHIFLKTILFFFLLFQIQNLTAQITLFSEDFNSSSSLPTGWTQEAVSGSDVWSINNGGHFNNGSKHPATAHSGTRNAYLWSMITTRKLVTPSINLGGMGNVQLKFYEAREQWGTDQDKLSIYYKKNSSSLWVQITSFTSNTPNWTLRTVNLPNPSSTYKIAFHGIAKYGYGICIDDVIISGQIANDAGVTNVSVERKKYIKATIKNYGANNLTSVKIKLSVDGSSPSLFNWTGNIAQYSSTSVIIDTINFSHGIHSLKLWTSDPNTTADGNNTNDTLNFPYKIIKILPYTESFENGSGNWLQSSNDNIDWIRKSGVTPTYGTGPNSAHNGSYYYYIEASGNYNKTASIFTPDIDLTLAANPHIKVWYSMNGSDMGSLHFDVDTADSWVNDFSTSISGNHGSAWQSELIDLSNLKNLDKLSFRGITGSGFLSDIAIDDILIIDVPNINLGNDTTFCSGQSLIIDAGYGLGYSYVWKDTNSTDTLATTQMLTVDSSGMYYVIVDAGYGYTDIDSISISIKPFPVASFTLSDSTSCFEGNSFSFTNNSTISSGNINYNWSFGDTLFSTSTNPSHSYTFDDTFEVKLIAISDFQCIDSTTKTIHIFPNPKTNFSANDSSQCFDFNSFTFYDSTEINSGSISNILWSFGDLTTSTALNPTHQYSSEGIYSVKLIATSNFNCLDSITKNIYVRTMPTADFSINDSAQCFDGNNYIVTNNSSISSGTLSYFWEFGQESTSSSKDASYSFLNKGKKSIYLLATSNYNCKDSVEKEIMLHETPIANFSVNDSSQCLSGNSFKFSNLSSISSGQIISNNWYFGNNDTSTFLSPTYSYLNDGNYFIKLVTKSDQLCKDSLIKKVFVHPVPETDFTIADSSQCFNGNNFKFYNNTTISSGTMVYLWNFGDKITTQHPNISHSYNSCDTFHVKLLATSDYMCKDSITKTILVNPEPTALFHITDSIQCFNTNNFQFVNSSTIATGTFNSSWQFGNNNNSSVLNPQHSYQNSGNYSIKLLVNSVFGCTDSTYSSVIINPNPESNFTVNDSTQCLNGNKFIFTNTSTIATGTLNSSWQFGDNNNSSLLNPQHSFSSDGNYFVKLLAISDKDCGDSTLKEMTVFPQPIINLGNDTSLTFKDSIILSANPEFDSILWSDNSTAYKLICNISNLKHGSNSIFVHVTDSNACTNSDTIIITFDTVNSINNVKIFSNIKIYPNPTYGKINIEITNPLKQRLSVSIYNIQGKVLFYEKLNNNRKINKMIDISNESKGFYFIKISSGNFTDVKKIILK